MPLGRNSNEWQFCQGKASYIGSLDQSTTGTKFSVYKFDGRLVDQEIIPHQQISHKEGWLEHNPNEIYENVLKSMNIVMERLYKK